MNTTKNITAAARALLTACPLCGCSAIAIIGNQSVCMRAAHGCGAAFQR